MKHSKSHSTRRLDVRLLAFRGSAGEQESVGFPGSKDKVLIFSKILTSLLGLTRWIYTSSCILI